MSAQRFSPPGRRAHRNSMKKIPVPGLLGSFIIFVTALFLLHTALDYNRTLAVARKSSARVLDQSSHTVHAELRRISYAVQQLFAVIDRGNQEGALDFLTPRTVNRITVPFLKNDASITSLNYGSSAGNGYLLLQTSTAFRNRIKRAGDAGAVTWVELDAQGRETARSVQPDDYDPRSRPWYREAAKGNGIRWGEPYIFRTTGDLGITASLALSPRHGKAGEVVGADITLNDLSRFLGKIAVHEQIAIDVFDEQGFLLASSRYSGFEKRPAGRAAVLPRVSDPEYGLQNAIFERFRTSGQDQFDLSYGGVRYFAKVAPFSLGEGKTVLTVMTLPRNAFMAEFLAAFYRNIALFVLSLSVLAAYFLSRYLMPMRRIAAYAREFNLDTPTLPLPLKGASEVEALAVSVNAMVDTIRQKAAALRLSEEHYRTLVQSAGCIILRWDTTGAITFINEPGAEFFGYRPEELTGKHVIGTIVAEIDSSGNDLVGMIEGICADPQAYVSNRNENVTKDGRRAWINWSNVAVRDERGMPIEILSVGIDVTFQVEAEREIKALNDRLEQRVRERTAAYEASNRELEAFCYSVSHDLRAPLRHIDGFSRILQEDYASSLPDQARSVLERISQSAGRMAELIDDLLNLSRVARQEMSPVPVNLSAIAREVSAELHQTDPLRLVSLTIADGVQVKGDAFLLRLVLENLLGNAWKYTAHASPARITFGVDMTPEGPACFVSDNGVGFDMAYVGKLFQPFQRLHRTDEFEGTGIGLAIVHRIIARHGGRVWATGEIGKGAAFFFLLPQ